MRLKILVANNHFSFNQRRITNRPIYPAAKNIVKKDVRNQELKKKNCNPNNYFKTRLKILPFVTRELHYSLLHLCAKLGGDRRG
jgi:hypothetical protein